MRKLILGLIGTMLLLAIVARAEDAFTSGGFAQAPEGAFDFTNAPAPLFRDPMFDGAADPSVVWNGREKAWYIYYTQRRANQMLPGVSWCYGTKIGIAKSTDQGRTWEYAGTAQGLSRGVETETLWAPHVFEAEGQYHMFVVYIPTMAIMHWAGKGQVAHYTSKDMLHWEFSDLVDVKSDNVIDPGVVKLKDGRWLMVFRDDNAGARTAKVVSTDLKHWTRLDDVTGKRSHEAPVVLYWKDKFWLFVDEWHGLGVYNSDDGIHYTHNNVILDMPGQREDDGYFGSHPGIALAGDRALVFYHVHAGRTVGGKAAKVSTETYESKRTSLQVAELEVRDGKMECNRDKFK